MITETQLGLNTQQNLERVTDSHLPMMVTRNNMPAFVIMAFDDFASDAETRFFMDRPGLRDDLLQSIAELNSGKTVSRTLGDLSPTWSDEA